MNKIKELRLERNLSIRKLANELGINYSTLASYESEQRDLNTTIIKKLASYFEVSTDYLLYYDAKYIYAKYLVNDKIYQISLDDRSYNELKKYIYFDNNQRLISLNNYFEIKEYFDVLNFMYIIPVENYIDDDQIVLTENYIKFVKQVIKNEIK